MEITFIYILSQIFTIIMYGLAISTYFLHDQHRIIIVNGLSLIANIIAYALLGAWSGLAMCVMAILRNVYILWDEHKHGKRDKIEKRDYIFFGFIVTCAILATIPTYNGPLSLLATFSFLTYSYSIWQKSTKVYKFCGIPVGILSISYNAYIKSLFAVIFEVILLISAIVGYITEIKSNKDGKIKDRK